MSIQRGNTKRCGGECGHADRYHPKVRILAGSPRTRTTGPSINRRRVFPTRHETPVGILVRLPDGEGLAFYANTGPPLLLTPPPARLEHFPTTWSQ